MRTDGSDADRSEARRSAHDGLLGIFDAGALLVRECALVAHDAASYRVAQLSHGLGGIGDVEPSPSKVVADLLFAQRPRCRKAAPTFEPHAQAMDAQHARERADAYEH